MITRKEYMEKKCSHREYYSQFVTEYHIKTVEKIDLHAKLALWDELFFSAPKIRFSLVGEFLTDCVRICILKEAKQQQLERN